MNTYILKNEHVKLLEELSGIIFRRPTEDGTGNYVRFVIKKFETMILPQLPKGVLTIVKK